MIKTTDNRSSAPLRAIQESMTLLGVVINRFDKKVITGPEVRLVLFGPIDPTEGLEDDFDAR